MTCCIWKEDEVIFDGIMLANFFLLIMQDDTSTVALDLEVLGRIKDWVYLENYGDVLFKPCLQVGFAYTAVLEDRNEGYITVRRMRITTNVLPVAHDTESLYSSLDPEALAVVSSADLVLTPTYKLMPKFYVLCPFLERFFFTSLQSHLSRIIYEQLERLDISG